MAPFTDAQWKRLTLHNSVVIKNESGLLERTIHPGDCVFIRHAEMEPGSYPGNAYWKGKIIELRSNKKVGHHAQVQWFYSKEDIQGWLNITTHSKIVESLAPTELVLSNHLDFIEVDAIEDVCTIHAFDDKKPAPAKFPAQDWFHRGTLDATTGRLTGFNKTCVCKGVYDMVKGLQRYCLACGHWLDTECIDTSSNPEPAVAEGDATLIKLARSPIARGLGNSREAPTWEYYGNGRPVMKAQEWVEAQNPPKNWKSKIGKEMLGCLVEMEWTWYECPNCGSNV